MGGGTTRVGDPSGKDETRAHPPDRGDRGQQGGHQARLRHVSDVRRRRRRDAADGRQRRMAGAAQLHRVSARRRPPLLGQPHADDGLGQAAPRARAGAVVHRVQLHAAAGLRFRRAGAALRLQPADGRLRPVGQHRHRHRPRPAHGHAPALRADLPAADDRPPAPRWARRPPAPCGSTRTSLSAYDYWQFWRNTEDADVGALPEAVHDAAAGRDRASWRASGRGDQRGQEGAGHRGDRSAAWPRQGRGSGRNRRARRSSRVRWPKVCRRSRSPRADLETGLGVLAAFVMAGLVKSNGEARRQIQGGGLRGQRCAA